MRTGVRPSEFWDLTPVEYNLIVEAYTDAQKETLYRDLRNAYYTGCFSQVEKPSEFYDKVVGNLSLESQSAEDMFNFLKNVMQDAPRDNVLDFKFSIPLVLTPEFDVGVFSYIYKLEGETLSLHLPDVAVSLDGGVLTPVKDVYSLRPGTVNIKYLSQVYTIIVIRV